MRRFASKINKKFVKKEADKITDKDVEKAIGDRQKIEDKLKESGRFEKYFEIIKLMFKMLNDYRKGNYREVPWLTISAMTFTLLYILNPLDLIPDFIPLIGYLDDVSVLAVALNLIQTDLHKYAEWKEKQGVLFK